MLSKYFKPGQKLQIYPRHPEGERERLESLTGYVNFCGSDYVDLALPYQTPSGEEYPFSPEMKLLIASEAFGMGVKVEGTFGGFRGSDLVRVRCKSDLQLYQRRVLPRIDLPVGLRYAKSKGHLRSMRQKWEKNLAILDKVEGKQRIAEFPYCPVNISGGGIRFSFRDHAEVADICLLLLELEPQNPPVCTVAEIVWMRPAEKPGWKTAGLQFIHIRKSDQERIRKFVARSVREMERKGREQKQEEAS